MRQNGLKEAGDKPLPSKEWNVSLGGIILEGALSAITQTMELTQAAIVRRRNYSLVLLHDE